MAPLSPTLNMRKGAGISALSRHTTTTNSFSTLSTTISESQLQTLQTSLTSFRESLSQFAQNHRNDIRADPAFRHQFQKMCAAIGVDPLQSSTSGSSSGGGGWWGGLGLGEWTCEVAVQVVDICVSTRERNGGMIEVGELVRRIDKMRGGKGGITQEDVLRSIDLLRPLHAGYTIHPIGGTVYVRSVPRELDMDQGTLLVIAAGNGGRLNSTGVKRHTGWSEVRCRTALDDCVMREGLGWVDDQAPGGRDVWLIAAVDFGEVTGADIPDAAPT